MDWGRSVEAVDAAKRRHKEWQHDADNWRAVRDARTQTYPPNAVAGQHRRLAAGTRVDHLTFVGQFVTVRAAGPPADQGDMWATVRNESGVTLRTVLDTHPPQSITRAEHRPVRY